MRNLRIEQEKKIKVDKILIHSLIRELKSIEKFRIESLQINFVHSSTMIKINGEYLGHNYSTDILTFNYSGNTENLDGEIFICISVALENALRYKVNLDQEILRLIIHGLLHMIGLDDKSPQDRQIMKRKENALVSLFEIEYKNIIIEYDCEDC
ncbi:MAG: rRNA maturation RNase YbeY [Melioribacteraceae bacterium]|nr:rRNA maturation RNase YbeY [Melioribacteraceae bacterium]